MRLDELIDFPKEWPALPDKLMSNFDHSIDPEVAATMKEVRALASYPGWNFNATCWWDGASGRYFAAVRRYHALRATFAAETPAQLMQEISDEFGYE